MNILFLSPWLPWPPFGGALIRILETLRWASARHRITLLTLLRDRGQVQYVKEVAGLCDDVITARLHDDATGVLRRLSGGVIRGRPLIQSMHYHRDLAEHVRRLTAQDRYDIIHVEFSFMAPYLQSVSPRSRARKVLVMHNVESRRFERELQFATGTRRLALLADRLLFRSWEEACVRQFDGIVAVSELERQWVQTHAPGAAVQVLPNGVNLAQFTPVEPPTRSRTIAFTGLMNYPPNVDAVVWFCDEVLPLIHRTHPDVRFSIIGDKPPLQVRELAVRRGVTVTGRVTDVRPQISDCLAVVVPVRSGAGTRLKILEAMAMKRPVVSTALGAEGLDVVHGKHLLLGDTPAALASHIVSLIETPALRDRIASAGRELVQAKYEWGSCLARLDDLYHSLAEPGGARRTAHPKVS
jgi:sugar transferase (PEP-CTERM/EpsH1 system associated)